MEIISENKFHAGLGRKPLETTKDGFVVALRTRDHSGFIVPFPVLCYSKMKFQDFISKLKVYNLINEVLCFLINEVLCFPKRTLITTALIN